MGGGGCEGEGGEWARDDGADGRGGMRGRGLRECGSEWTKCYTIYGHFDFVLYNGAPISRTPVYGSPAQGDLNVGVTSI